MDYRASRAKFYWRDNLEHDAQWWREYGRYVIVTCRRCKKMCLHRWARLQCRQCDGSFSTSALISVPETEPEIDRKEDYAMTDTQTETPNGTAPVVKEPSLVAQIRENWDASKPVDMATVKKLIAQWKSTEKSVADATKAADAARDKGYAAAKELAELVGCTPLKIEGVLFEFTSRGDKVFLRSKGSRSNVIDV